MYFEFDNSILETLPNAKQNKTIGVGNSTTTAGGLAKSIKAEGNIKYI